MKDSAESESGIARDTNAFQRFAKVLRALVAVPKNELAEKLAEDNTGHSDGKRYDNARVRRRTHR